MLFPLIGAGLGGIEGYRRSGGDLGATLLGAGLGAATPAGLRMAGTALGGMLSAPSLTRASAALLGQSSKAAKYAAGLGTEGAKGLAAKGIQQTVVPGLASLSKNIASPVGIGALAAGGGLLLGAPGLAAQVAAGLSPAARTVAGGASGLGIPAMQPGQAVYDAGAAVPGGPVQASPYNVGNVVDPKGEIAAGRVNQLLEADVQLANIRKYMPELFKAAEARSKTEFQRQMAAAGIRQNIATAANMLQNSQLAAQQMGSNAAQQMGSALTSQYQYS